MMILLLDIGLNNVYTDIKNLTILQVFSRAYSFRVRYSFSWHSWCLLTVPFLVYKEVIYEINNK